MNWPGSWRGRTLNRRPPFRATAAVPGWLGYIGRAFTMNARRGRRRFTRPPMPRATPATMGEIGSGTVTVNFAALTRREFEGHHDAANLLIDVTATPTPLDHRLRDGGQLLGTKGLGRQSTVETAQRPQGIAEVSTFSRRLTV